MLLLRAARVGYKAADFTQHTGNWETTEKAKPGRGREQSELEYIPCSVS